MRKLIFFLTIFMFLNIRSIAVAQPNVEWVTKYGAAVDLQSACIRIDSASNLIVAGYKFQDTSIIILNKYSPQGVLIWSKQDKGHQNSGARLYDMAIDDKNNIFITGYAYDDNHPFVYVAKFDSTGIRQWAKGFTYNFTYNSWGFKIKIDLEKNIYIAGESNYSFLRKYNALNGDTLWTKYIPGMWLMADIAVDTQNNVCIAGRVSGFTAMKFTSAGLLIWQSSVAGNDPTAMAIDHFNNVYITGMNYGSSTEMDCQTVKFDSSGNLQWVKYFLGNHYDEGLAIAIDGFQNVIISGFSENNSYMDDFLAVKYNPQGVMLWSAIYTGVGNREDHAIRIVVDNYGSAYLTGPANALSPNSGRYQLVKINSNGIIEWAKHYTAASSGFNQSRDLVIDRNNNLYITGVSAVNNSANDELTTIKYSQLVGFSGNNEVSEKYFLHQNYPNPFNPSTVIRYQLSVAGFTSLKVFDLLGKEVASLVNEKQSAGSYAVDFNSSEFNLPSGIYFYTLNAGEFTETRKMVLIK